MSHFQVGFTEVWGGGRLGLGLKVLGAFSLNTVPRGLLGRASGVAAAQSASIGRIASAAADASGAAAGGSGCRCSCADF